MRYLRRARPAGADQQVTWTDLSASVISMDEKRAHAAEILQTAERHAGLRAEIEDRAREFSRLQPSPPPRPRLPVTSYAPGDQPTRRVTS